APELLTLVFGPVADFITDNEVRQQTVACADVAADDIQPAPGPDIDHAIALHVDDRRHPLVAPHQRLERFSQQAGLIPVASSNNPLHWPLSKAKNPCGLNRDIRGLRRTAS